MTQSLEETTLAKARLHWGIFIPVGVLTLAVAVGVLAVMSVVRMLRSLGRAFGPLSAGVAALHTMSLLPLILAFIVVGGGFLLTWIAYTRSEITLTNRRLVFRTGLLSKHTGELPLENVESIGITEPLLGQICGYGTVTVTTVGGSGLPLAFLRAPQSFHEALQEAVRSRKNSVRGISKPPEPAPLSKNDDSRYMPKG